VPPNLTLPGAAPTLLPSGQAVLLLNDSGTWRVLGTRPYPGDLPPAEEWTSQLSSGPFCRQ
jgi:hypothetical protein